MKMEIQLLLPRNETRRQANKVWDRKGYRDQILPNGYIVRYFSNGDKHWFNQNGQYHRLDGPAIERLNGYKAWFQNDQLHRLDGPSVEYPNGNKYWYIESKEYTEKEFNELRKHNS